jgi:hypothetical protein
MKVRDNMLRKVLLGLAFFAILTLGYPDHAHAGEFVSPTFANIVKIIVRLGALDTKDNDALDSYAMVEECQLYQKLYHDDFKWNKFQTALRKSIAQDVNTFPTGIYYNTELQLARYDFKQNIFSFTPNTSLKNVNLFKLDAKGDVNCGANNRTLLPADFNIVIDQPLNLSGLPLGKENAATIFHRLEGAGNTDHIIFTRFQFRIVYVEHLVRAKNADGKKNGPFKQPSGTAVRLDSRLDSIDFYEDSARTKLIYTYRP